MKELILRNKLAWTNRNFLISTLLGLALLLIGFIVTYYANAFATVSASNYVSDLILDNVPVMGVDFLYYRGILIFIAFLTLILFYEPKRIPFILKIIAVFYLVRSFFMILTHLALPIDVSSESLSSVSNFLSSGADLFFSGHAGAPFIIALAFWNNKTLRFIFLAGSVFGALMVILGHMHYSIDVFSAYFIAYGIYKFCQYFFREDHQRAGLGRPI